VQPELVETGKLQRDIEALLFVCSEALSIKELAKLTGAELSAVTETLAQIDADFAERGIVLREVAGGYRFASAPAALETLAIAAYLQPVTKGDIEGIRGVSADSVISTLLDRRFLTESGRKDVPGRPIVYKTTDEFLEAFGLRSLEELPSVDVDAGAPIELALPISLDAAADVAPAEDATDAPLAEAEAEVETEPKEMELQPSAV
jgi:segregation and condensation protein B